MVWVGFDGIVDEDVSMGVIVGVWVVGVLGGVREDAWVGDSGDVCCLFVSDGDGGNTWVCDEVVVDCSWLDG